MLLVLWCTCHQAWCRPPLQQQGDPQQPETVEGGPGAAGNGSKDWDLGIEYNRYLQEVVQVLESDPDFRKKLEDADVDKIRDGSIANELDFVHHGVRTQLDDIKRRELERLRHLSMRQYELSEGIDKKHAKIPHHLDVKMPTFEKDDLKRLIKSTTKDLEEADQKRRDEFKTYEMEKRFEEEQRLAHIEDEKKREEERLKAEELKKKHRQHDTPHHPMTKDQLEEVWEEQDHMPKEEFDPKTFFAMHDLDGNGVWDEDEIKMLFAKELEKVYDPDAPEDDMREREEEMERMREHVFKEADLNKDKLISYEEFLTETKRDEFDNDPGWHTLDEDEQEDFYSDDEFRAYEAQRQREIQDMLNRGIVPQNYQYLANLPPGAQAFPPHPGLQPPPPPGGHRMGGMGQQQPQLGIPGQPAYHAPPQPVQPQQPQQQQQFGQAPVQPVQPVGNQQQQQFVQQPVPRQPSQQHQFGGAPPPPQPGQPVPVQPQQVGGGLPQHQQAQQHQFGASDHQAAAAAAAAAAAVPQQQQQHDDVNVQVNNNP